MSAYRTRRGLAVSSVLLLCALLTGCVGGFGFACPAIGYTSTVRVQLVGNAEDVAEVRMCDENGNCSAPVNEPDLEDAPLVVIDAENLGEVPTEPSAAPTRRQVYFYAGKNNENAWSIQVLSGSPRDVEVTAYRSDGTVAGESSNALEWVRVGGSERCGGPMEAGPLEIVIG